MPKTQCHRANVSIPKGRKRKTKQGPSKARLKLSRASVNPGAPCPTSWAHCDMTWASEGLGSPASLASPTRAHTAFLFDCSACCLQLPFVGCPRPGISTFLESPPQLQLRSHSVMRCPLWSCPQGLQPCPLPPGLQLSFESSVESPVTPELMYSACLKTERRVLIPGPATVSSNSQVCLDHGSSDL